MLDGRDAYIALEYLCVRCSSYSIDVDACCRAVREDAGSETRTTGAGKTNTREFDIISDAETMIFDGGYNQLTCVSVVVYIINGSLIAVGITIHLDTG